MHGLLPVRRRAFTLVELLVVIDKSKMKQNTPPEEIIETPELFPAHTLSVQIPPPEGRLDIEVPAN
ncbi:MAG: type II secretion system protein [Planctomycetes bacterium]|nr:type II secretion system protein [Planctomycetota bacterium]